MANIKNDLTAGLSEDLRAIYNQVYVVNDWDPMHVWDGYRTSMVRAGIRPPHEKGRWSPQATVSTGGSVDVGIHVLRYRYLDGKTQYPSNPSNIKIVDVSASPASPMISRLTVYASPDPKVDTIVLEATRANGDQFFVGTSVPNSTQVIQFKANDTQLATRPLYWDDFGHEVPPYFNVLEAFRGRLWGLGHVVWSAGKATNTPNTVLITGTISTQWKSAAVGRLFRFSGEATRRFIVSVDASGRLILDRKVSSAHSQNRYTITPDAPDVLTFSKPVFPQSWPVLNQIKVLDGKPETGRALKGFRQDLMIFGERKVQALVFGAEPFEDGRLEDIPGERGAASPRVVIDVGGQLYSLDYKGIHRYAGGAAEPQHVSEFLDPYFDPSDMSKGYVDFSCRDSFHAVHFPQLHQVLFFVVLNGLPDDTRTYTLPQHAFVYDYLNETWGVLRFGVPITCSTNVRGANGRNYTVLGDSNGYLWVYGASVLDGPPSSALSLVSVKSTSGNVVWVSGGTLYTQNLGLRGVPVYWPSQDAVRVISQNSTDRFTLDSAFAGLSNGKELHIGGIRSKLKSKAFAWWTEKMVMQGRYLHLYYQPRSTGQARLRFYNERSVAAETHSLNLDEGGVAMSAGRDYFTLDLSHKKGVWRVPLPRTTFHVVEWELEVFRPGTQLVLLRYEMDGQAEGWKDDSR